MRGSRTPELARIQALILAGGQGERLRPLTGHRPKPAVSFGETFRIIDFTLSNCFHSEIADVSLLTQYRHEQLLEYVHSGWGDFWVAGQSGRKPLRVLPSSIRKPYRGTADAAFQNTPLLQDNSAETVLVLSADHIYQMDYGEFVSQHLDTNADLTIATVEYPLDDATRFGVVETDGDSRVTGFEEKPINPRPAPSRTSAALVSMGVYLFKKSVLLNSLRNICGADLGYDFGRDIVPSLDSSGRTYAYDFRDEVHGRARYWRDIGTLDSFYEASMDLIAPESTFDPFANFASPSQPTRHPMLYKRRETSRTPRIGRCCDVSGTVVSQGVQVGDNAIISNSVLMPGVRIGNGVRLNRAIIDEDVEVPAYFQAGYDDDQDRQEHTVTKNGIVVVGTLAAALTPASASASPRDSFRQVISI